MPTETASQPRPPQRSAESLNTTELAAVVKRLLAGLRFGSVTLTLHDGQIVQTERTEKYRLR